ncbi:hypothetical protein [Dactylosporangium salmoneum]|uniref:Homeodomain-like domain-containing protein n=1 Tax=Dactylosporangium salmoneum TaxID=53361 RepID=A0ABP5SBQ5_9ACTN
MTPPSSGSRRILTVFYVVVAGVALAGAGLAAADWLSWPWPLAFAAVGAVELGGAVISNHAGARMRLGERAAAARVLSAAVAAGAVSVNWLGHGEHRGQAAFFAGMSALGYFVWLIDSSARRRDELRARGMLAAVPPAYGVARWLRHPAITREARALAVERPELGLYGSIAAARDARRREQRHAAIAVLLRRKLSQGKDQVAAELAIATYDLDEIAARLAAAADYDGLTDLLGAELTAAAVAGIPDTAVDIRVDTAPVDEPAVDNDATAPDSAPAPAETPKMGTDRARLVAQSMYRANPGISLDIIADTIGMSRRTVQRYTSEAGRPVSGAPAIVATPRPPHRLSPDDALDVLESGHIADPAHRRQLAQLALGSSTETTAALAAA